MRSHDLNRLLDESGSGRNGIKSLKISFSVVPAARGIGVTKPDGANDSRHHCNGAQPRLGIWRCEISRNELFLAEPSQSARFSALACWMGTATYVAAISSRLARVGGAFTGKMRRRTMAIAAPQQRQSSWGR